MASPRAQAQARSAVARATRVTPLTHQRSSAILPTDHGAVAPRPRYHDYAYVEGHGWWPRWYPYWDQRWYDYWWTLYAYYGGDGNPEYAAYARDAILRQYAPQWGLVVSGADPGASTRQLAAEPAAYRAVVLQAALRIYAATHYVLFGYRLTSHGSELTLFGTRAGLARWAAAQAADPDVTYAAAFDLEKARTPFAEVAR